MSTTLQQAVSLLKAAHDLIGTDEADADPTLAAVRSACRMGLDASAPQDRTRPTLASWGEPAKRSQKWMLHFEDTEVGTIVYDAALYGEEETELLAREAYRTARQNWNCTLLKVATLDPFQEDRQRVRAEALEASLRELRATIERTQPNHREDLDMRIRADLALGDVAPDEVPVARIVAAIRPANARNVRAKRKEMDDHLESVRNSERFHSRHPSEDEDEERQRAEGAKYKRDKSAQLERDIARLVRMEKALGDDPASLLLPLGSLVQIAEFDATEMLDTDWPLPIGGSRGVVTGYSTLAGRPNVVSFITKVTDTSGMTVPFNDERPYSVNYLPEELVVVSNGKLCDGTAIDVPGWWPTHGHGAKGHILYSESMVVVSGRRRWRIQPCSGPPELTQVTTDDAKGDKEFEHLVPLDARIENTGEIA